MAYPIWKDYFVNLPIDSGSNNTAPFRITTGGTTIYSGVAYPKTSGAASVQVRINDICADYFGREFIGEDASGSVLRKTFKVYSTQNGSETERASVEFYNDWSFDPAFIPEVDGFAFPVVPYFAPGQLLVFSPWDWQDVPHAFVEMADGTIIEAELLAYDETLDFNNDFNLDFSIEYTESGFVFLPMDQYLGAKAVTIGDITWKASDACPKYVIYYVNAHGGWDSLLVNGTTKMEDSVKRYTSGKVYDNGYTYNRGKVNYANELTRTFKMHFGPFGDSASERMHHLLNSPAVYIHDLQARAIYPLVLTGNNTEHKTYRTNGAKLSEYEVPAELAQDRIRR